MRKRIQKSMILTLLVTLIPFYIIMSLALYYKNMSLLEKEVRQEGKYISGAINMAGTHYLEQLEQLDQIDTGTRLTLIEEDGTVLYDSKVSGATMDNHSSRKEVEEAFSSGEGEVVRMSSTVQKELYYYALRLDDGSVLRVSKTMDSLIWTALNVFPVMLILSVAGIVLAVVLARWQTKKLMDPVIHLDLEHPLENVIYEEMTPFLEAMDVQNKEKEAVSNMRKEFSANVSHELKTPLTSISGYAEIMMNGLVRPEDIQGFSERIYKEARRLITLVEDIIKLSKLDDESVELEKEDVDLYNLTREIVSRLSPQSNQKKIHVSVSGEPVIFNGIKQILDEMIYNITENAIKYNNDGGYVDVWVGNTLNGPKVSVEDNGIGIPKEHQERIFERFYRVDKSHSKERGGTGLGLSIVKHGAIIHGANVNVDSAPGRGTKIEIQFPLEQKKKEAETGTKE